MLAMQHTQRRRSLRFCMHAKPHTQLSPCIPKPQRRRRLHQYWPRHQGHQSHPKKGAAAPQPTQKQTAIRGDARLLGRCDRESGIFVNLFSRA